ncbi:MAG: protein-glutamate O-methyltransferase CheR [Pirellulales bacterium]
MNSETKELELVLNAIQRTCRYDFRHYTRPSLHRRLTSLQTQSNLPQLADMVPWILHDANFLNQVLRTLSIAVTELFRDPSSYQTIRRKVVPTLKALPSLKIWHAGCATGEEVYSLAILLKEEGLYDRARIYATDFNNSSLHAAEKGIYSLETIRKGASNYLAAGGHGSFSDYYHAQYRSAKIQECLKENITFSHHNLVLDGSFGEMDLILCKNVMIYFDQSLKQRVYSLFSESLREGGFLCLGAKETLDFSYVRESFGRDVEEEKIYRKKVDTYHRMDLDRLDRIAKPFSVEDVTSQPRVARS